MSKINQEMMESFKLNMNKSAIPDMGEMLEILKELLEYIETPEMKILEKENHDNFETKLYNRYNTKLPMKIISLMVEEDRYDNLDELINMFDTLNDIKNGKKNIQDEFKKFNEKLNEKYLYEKYGGKEGFEKTFSPKKK